MSTSPVSSSPAQLFIERCEAATNYFISAAKANGSKYETYRLKSGATRVRYRCPEPDFDFVSWFDINTQKSSPTWELQFSRSILSIPDCELGGQWMSSMYSIFFTELQYLPIFCMRFEFCVAECMQIMRAIHDPSYWPTDPTAGFTAFATGLGLHEVNQVAYLKMQLATAMMQLAKADKIIAEQAYALKCRNVDIRMPKACDDLTRVRSLV
jgi:hypothetical protein